MQLPTPTPARVERALNEVYARPEFAPPRPSPVGDWLRDAWNAAGDLLASLLPQTNLSAGGLRVIFWIVVGVLALAALLIAAHFAGAIARLWRGRERTRGAERRSAGAAPLPLGAADWEDRARRAAADGRWRDAARALYQALLLHLAERGAVRYDPSKTPGDYRREVRGDAEASRALNSFLRLWEPIVFGGRAIDGSAYERLRATTAEASARG